MTSLRREGRERIVIALVGLQDVSTEELKWVREFLKPWLWAFPGANVAWHAENRWLVLACDPGDDPVLAREMAAQQLANAVFASVAGDSNDRDLEVRELDAEPDGLSRKGTFPARPKTYHFGSTRLSDSEAERLLADRKAHDENSRDLPVARLTRDPDPLFHPRPAVREAAKKLDRPIVPLLNALDRLGCPTTFSCAGHLALAEATRELAETDPYVSMAPSRRALAVCRLLGPMFASWLIDVRDSPRHGDSCILRLSDRVTSADPAPPRSVRQRRELDQSLVDAAERVLTYESELLTLRTDEPSEEAHVVAEIGVESTEDWPARIQAGLLRKREECTVPIGPLVVLRQLGPTGGAEIHMWSYGIGASRWNVTIAAGSIELLLNEIRVAMKI